MAAKKKKIEVHKKEEIETRVDEPSREGVYYSPAVDIFETDEAITVLADLPGVGKSDLHVDVRDQVLTITGHVTQPAARLEPTYREYGVGGYTRRFTIGDEIDRTSISAALDDGVLELVLPKSDRLRPRKIEVTAS